MIYKTILVVEDNEINRTMLNTILADQYQVLEAENGEQAMVLLKQYHGRRRSPCWNSIRMRYPSFCWIW